MKVDIAIIGSGPGGLGACAFLAHKGRGVTLIGDRPSSAVLFSGAVLSPEGSSQLIPEDKFNEATEKFINLLGELYPLHRSTKTEDLIVESGGIIPSTLWAESSRFANIGFLLHKRVLFIGISSLTTFIPELVVGRLKRYINRGTENWETKTITLNFPKNFVEQSQISLSKALDNKENFKLFAEALLHLKGIESYDAIMLPPVLGINNFLQNLDELRKLLKPPISELLSAIPSTNGARLHRAMEKYLTGLSSNTSYIINRRCTGFSGNERIETLKIAPINGEGMEITPHAVIYAPGRFLGGGIKSHDDFRESLFGIPLHYKNNKLSPHFSSLFSYNITDPQPGLEAVLRVNENLQPLNGSGKPFAKNLYCAGGILVGRSGVLQAFATGYIAGGHALCG